MLFKYVFKIFKEFFAIWEFGSDAITRKSSHIQIVMSVMLNGEWPIGEKCIQACESDLSLFYNFEVLFRRSIAFIVQFIVYESLYKRKSFLSCPITPFATEMEKFNNTIDLAGGFPTF
jgi:hypothetical protein